jgi:hypothetical protein
MGESELWETNLRQSETHYSTRTLFLAQKVHEQWLDIVKIVGPKSSLHTIKSWRGLKVYEFSDLIIMTRSVTHQYITGLSELWFLSSLEDQYVVETMDPLLHRESRRKGNRSQSPTNTAPVKAHERFAEKNLPRISIAYICHTYKVQINALIYTTNIPHVYSRLTRKVWSAWIDRTTWKRDQKSCLPGKQKNRTRKRSNPKWSISMLLREHKQRRTCCRSNIEMSPGQFSHEWLQLRTSMGTYAHFFIKK